jgi:hypothetical protein
MDAQWTVSAVEMMGFLDAVRQLRRLSGDLTSLRTALTGTRCETMEGRELAMVAKTAMTMARRRAGIH